MHTPTWWVPCCPRAARDLLAGIKKRSKINPCGQAGLELRLACATYTTAPIHHCWSAMHVCSVHKAQDLMQHASTPAPEPCAHALIHALTDCRFWMAASFLLQSSSSLLIFAFTPPYTLSARAAGLWPGAPAAADVDGPPMLPLPPAPRLADEDWGPSRLLPAVAGREWCMLAGCPASSTHGEACQSSTSWSLVLCVFLCLCLCACVCARVC